MTAAWFLLAVAAAPTLAIGLYPALTWPAWLRVGALLVLGTSIALMPLLVPAHSPLARLVAACIDSCFVLKLIDVHLGAQRGTRLELGSFLAFLGNPLHLVQRRTGAERQPSSRENRIDYLRSGVGVLLAFGMLKLSGRVDWSVWPFLFQHAIRATAFFVFILFLFQNLAALMRAFGLYSVDPVDQPFKARTPADFWRRYNRWIGQFLHENVFKVLGGRRHPVRATLLAFGASGLLHEYLFLIATGRLHGTQMAFFLLQGVAVALTLRSKPTGAAALISGSATLVFNVLSSVLFFASMQAVGRMYPAGMPTWLPVP